MTYGTYLRILNKEINMALEVTLTVEEIKALKAAARMTNLPAAHHPDLKSALKVLQEAVPPSPVIIRKEQPPPDDPEIIDDLAEV